MPPFSSLLPVFGNPFALLGLFGIGALYLAYRKAKTSNRREIPSLFFIKQLDLPKQVTKSKKLPFRFYLESLVILLLVLYLANPELPGKGKRVAIFLDRSMSMATLNDRGLSRFDEATSALINYIDSQSSLHEYKLYELPFFLNKEVQPGTGIISYSSVSEIKQTLEKLKPVPFADSLEQIVPDLSEHLVQNKFQELLIVSDKSVEGSPHESIVVKSFSSSSQENNVYLISSRSRLDSSSAAALDITLGYSGSGSTNVTLTVKEISPQEKTVIKTDVAIQAGTEKIETLLLGDEYLKRSAIFKIESVSSPIRDALSFDNEIYVVHNPEVGDASVFFISPDVVKDKKIKDSIEVALQSNVLHLTCSKSADLRNRKKSKNTLFIFYKCPAPKELYGDTLVVLPSTSNELSPVKELKTKPTITSWNSSHQITRYIRLSLLSLPNALVFNEPSWGSSIIVSSEGPLMLAGSIAGNKLVVSGMELFPFEGSRNKVGSILLLNIFGSLKSSGSNTIAASYSRSQFSELQQLAGIEKINEDQALSTSELLISGIYRGTLIEDKKRIVFDVQNFYLEESNTYEKIKHTFNKEPINTNEDPTSSYSRFLLYAGLALLILDLLIVSILRREL